MGKATKQKPLTPAVDALARLAKAAYEQGYKHGVAAARSGGSNG